MKRLLILTVVAMLTAATTGCNGVPRWRPLARAQPAIPCEDGHMVGTEVYSIPAEDFPAPIPEDL